MFSESCIFARLSARKICDLWRNNTYIIKTDNPIVDAQKCAKFGRIWARTLSTEWLNAITKMEIKNAKCRTEAISSGKNRFFGNLFGLEKNSSTPTNRIKCDFIAIK